MRACPSRSALPEARDQRADAPHALALLRAPQAAMMRPSQQLL
jgi:hypothetical protein